MEGRQGIKEDIDYKIKELEDKIDYSFVNKDLILEAISHPSLNKRKSVRVIHIKNPEKSSKKSSSKKNNTLNLGSNLQFNYQRLEFLGDSVLNFAVTNFLVNRFNYGEGLLAKLRSYLISKNTIVEVAKKFDIGNFILMAAGEEKTGGRENINNIENVMEAIIGAMYMDCGIVNTLNWINKNWNEYYLKCYEEIDVFDPKSKLQEVFQSKKMGSPEYVIYSDNDQTTHNQVFYAEIDFKGRKFIGSGKNKKEAQKNCARVTLEYINYRE